MTKKESVPIKTREGEIQEILPAGTHDKKKIQTEIVVVHKSDGSLKMNTIPLLHPEEVDQVLRKDLVEKVFKDVRKSKKTVPTESVMTLAQLNEFQKQGKVELPKFPSHEQYEKMYGDGKKSKKTVLTHEEVESIIRKSRRKNTIKSDRKVKGTSDFIPYDIAMKTGLDLLWSGTHPTIGFYIVMSVNSGLRTGDVQRIKYSDMVDKKVGDLLVIQEEKTGKERKIKINDKIIDAFKYIYAYHLKRNKGTFKDDYIFRSRKGTTYRTISLNRILKEYFKGVVPTVSTHSLRKSFGRHVYDMNKQSEHALIVLSQIFSHTSLKDTRRYLGLSDEEIGDIYLNL